MKETPTGLANQIYLVPRLSYAITADDAALRTSGLAPASYTCGIGSRTDAPKSRCGGVSAQDGAEQTCSERGKPIIGLASTQAGTGGYDEITANPYAAAEGFTGAALDAVLTGWFENAAAETTSTLP